MKKLGILALVLALIMAFAIPTGILAAAETASDTLPDPGITPDSPFYFMDKWGKQISLAFTFNTESKVRKALQYAEERLAEAEAMAAQNKVRAMEKAANEYANCLAVATQSMTRAMNKGIDTSGQVADVTSQHLAYMYRHQAATNQQDGTACGDCEQIRLRMQDRAVTCQEDTVGALSSRNPEGALQLGTRLMEQATVRLQNMAGQADSEQIEEALQQCERYRAMNQQMVTDTPQQGVGTQTQQMAQECLANQEGVMEQVRNQYQLQNGSGDDSSNQNRQQGTTTTTTTATTTTDTVIETTQTSAGPMGPAPNSGDCIPDGSGFDGPNGPNGSGKGQS